MVPHDAFRTLIVAGGRAARMGSLRPKALLKSGGTNLLALALNEVLAAGMGPVLVATDRRDWLPETVECTRPFSGVSVRLVPTTTSTLLVARHVLSDMARRFLFVYGHAPRPASLYCKMRARAEALVVARTPASSKRKVIASARGGFIEPPYLLWRGLLDCFGHSEWDELLAATREAMAEVDVAGPREFNYPVEYLAYCEYVNAGWEVTWRLDVRRPHRHVGPRSIPHTVDLATRSVGGPELAAHAP